jgi:hypothetical protein
VNSHFPSLRKSVLLFDWGDIFLEADKAALKVRRKQDHHKKIRQLKRLADRWTMEKKFEKDRATPTPEVIKELAKMGYPLTVISSALDVSRSA